MCIPFYLLLFQPSLCWYLHLLYSFITLSSTFSLPSCMSRGGKKSQMGNLAHSECVCACIQHASSVFLLLFSILLASPLEPISICRYFGDRTLLTLPTTTDHTMTAFGNKHTYAHTQQVMASYPVVFIPKAPLGFWHLEPHLSVNTDIACERACAVVCESEFMCMCVCCQSHISHTYAVLTGVLEVSPVYAQKQAWRLLQLECEYKGATCRIQTFYPEQFSILY